jgi:hypothetical protein
MVHFEPFQGTFVIVDSKPANESQKILVMQGPFQFVGRSSIGGKGLKRTEKVMEWWYRDLSSTDTSKYKILWIYWYITFNK